MSFTHRIFKLMSSKYTSSNANACIQRIQHVHRPFLGRLCKELVIFLQTITFMSGRKKLACVVAVFVGANNLFLPNTRHTSACEGIVLDS